MDLSESELRVLGCLLEKQRTTPDVYPLSLNSLRLACNQSTNREPVVDYDEAVVRDALHRLERRGLVRLAGASRAPKFRHLLEQALPMSTAEQALMCVLMLRGEQTPGELKQRTERMYPFADLPAVHETLTQLIDRELVSCLGRRPGQKEDRYIHLLSDGHPAPPAPQQPSAPASPAPPVSAPPPQGVSATAIEQLSERLERVESEVAELRAAQRPTVRSPLYEQGND